jgi:polyisoprenyl-phosphate glycosyltransferase
MAKSKPLVSIIIPAYNEGSNIEWHHKKIREYCDQQSYKYEILYINDGSSDDTLGVIKTISRLSPNTHYISFSRNFGKESATAAGIRGAKGDVALIIDADGQHPIEMLGEFMSAYDSGYNIVAGVRATNEGAGVIDRVTSSAFYVLLGMLGGQKSNTKSTDFRLIDRKVMNAINGLTERNRVTRDLIDWIGFKKTEIPFDALERHSGSATYTFRKRAKLAINAIIGQSTRPLKFIALLGVVISFTSAVILAGVAINKYLFGDPLNLQITGVAILALFISLLIGVVLVCQGLLALYLESVYHETQNRPLYIVDEES